jgi:hypothetical protein
MDRGFRLRKVAPQTVAAGEADPGNEHPRVRPEEASGSFEGGSRRQLRQSLRLRTRTAFVPPKPNEFTPM